MKRLVSQSERDKKEKKRQVIIGISLACLMVLSILGFALQGAGRNSQEGEDKIIYNGLEFEYINGFWVIGSFAFRYNPEQVPEIGFGLKNASNYQGLPAYIYSENYEAETEVKMNLALFSEKIQNACPDEGGFNCSEGIPIKTCEDNFIIIKENNISSITQENNCVYIEGPQQELLKLADQFLFKVLKVK